MKKAYVVYLDDGTSVMRLDIPAESYKKAEKYAEGNGEIIACKLNDMRNADKPISLDLIAKALKNNQFGEMEIALITRALSDCEFIN